MSNLLLSFKNSKLVKVEVQKIFELAKNVKRQLCFMEVCGTHTMQISKYGIRRLLPENIKLISGPGCPVCVTPLEFIDKAIYILRNCNNVIIATFGDLYRVPSTDSSLEKEKAKGYDVRIIYSPYEVLDIVQQNPHKEVIFLSIGFETTMPAIGCVIKEAKEKGINNLSFLVGNKFFLPALEALILFSKNFSPNSFNTNSTINGFLLPGHLSVILGEKAYKWITEKYAIPSVITGFEPLDIVVGIRMLIEMFLQETPEVRNEYSRVVSYEGNFYAMNIINEVFNSKPGKWRGIGIIPNSTAELKKEFEKFDAEKKFNIPEINTDEQSFSKCRCNEVLIGKITPLECPLFAKLCTPQDPKGACMVSSEGACAAYYKYERIEL